MSSNSDICSFFLIIVSRLYYQFPKQFNQICLSSFQHDSNRVCRIKHDTNVHMVRLFLKIRVPSDVFRNLQLFFNFKKQHIPFLTFGKVLHDYFAILWPLFAIASCFPPVTSPTEWPPAISRIIKLHQLLTVRRIIGF